MLSYRSMAATNNLYLTPPTFAIYMVGLVLEHLRAAGEASCGQIVAPA